MKLAAMKATEGDIKVPGDGEKDKDFNPGDTQQIMLPKAEALAPSQANIKKSQF